jgi:hypothetical protein
MTSAGVVNGADGGVMSSAVCNTRGGRLVDNPLATVLSITHHERIGVRWANGA